MSSKLLMTEWMVAEGIIVWKGFRQDHHAPLPGRMLAASGAFVLLGLLASVNDSTDKVASLFGLGLVLAAGMNILPGVSTNKAETKVSFSSQTQAKTGGKA
jgi:hypothetical protein